MAQDAYQQPEQPARDPRSPGPDRSVPGVEVAHAGDRPTVHVIGRVDREKITEVAGAVRGLVAVGVHELVVDLSGSWDGSGLLPVLARTRAALADRGGTLRLVGVALPEFLPALRTAPLDEVFLIYDTVRSNRAVAVPAPRRGDPHTAEPVRLASIPVGPGDVPSVPPTSLTGPSSPDTSSSRVAG
jgi:hypothetical protein